jgi:ubiquinone/menaquinone biosynthesis C-methylase UbiE
MAEFHFVEDYQRFVDYLVANHPLEEAMSIAVGGNYETTGHIEADIMGYAGLKNGMSLLDLGCGSGRLAWALGQSMEIIYTGIDIVQALLDYAKTRTPGHYKFLLHRGLSIPLSDQSTDFVAAFSLFTHLLHSETYIYLKEIKRILKPGGHLVLSFLEFSEAGHWPVFEMTIASHHDNPHAHLNMFIERSALEIWASHLGFTLKTVVNAKETRWKSAALGQSIAILCAKSIC